MNPLQLELTKLIGKKELTFGCIYREVDGNSIADNAYATYWEYRIITESFEELFEKPESAIIEDWKVLDIGIGSEFTQEEEGTREIIGHPATLSDLHLYLNESKNIFDWAQNTREIYIKDYAGMVDKAISYDSSKDFLDQDEETLNSIRDLILSNQ